MKNYIDANELKAEIERQQRKLIVLLTSTKQASIRRDCALQNGVYNSILDIIDSLLQEQSEADTEEDDNKCPICGCALDAAGCCSYCGYDRR